MDTFLDVIACLPVSESGGRAIDSFRFEIATALPSLLPDEWQSAVLELHNNASKSAHGHWDIKQVEDKWLVFSKDIAGSHLSNHAQLKEG